MGALPAPKPSPLSREAQKIKGRVDALITKMQKDAKFTPTRDMLEEHAEQLIDYINDNHEKTAPHESYLKAAIIDLTEVPEMAPQMQRIAFLTALKDASHELELFLSCI
ncbi:MAG: hypothetical protein JSS60_05105 [Verrucomicrobia bacterium]|nr:hypothetical protein [Verrucomicrobiota bacterium]